MIKEFILAGSDPNLWKEDISKAFRRLPVDPEHCEFAWVIFEFKGKIVAVRHKAMPFGTISAVYAWHRAGAFYRAVLRRFLKAPTARYVGDILGSRKRE